MASQSEMDMTDRRLLNIIQSMFPLVEEPYLGLGKQLEISEAEVIERTKKLKKANVVRQISAIFDTRRLGYKTTLVAMRFPAETLDSSAKVINQHPGVSHNYARNGNFNLWFTLAVPPYESLEETIEDMVKRTGAESYRMMPTIKFFKIGVNFDMVKNVGAAYEYYSPDGYNASSGEDWKKAEPVTEYEIEVIKELQEDIALVPRPFDGMSKRLNVTPQELFAMAEAFKDKGIMRRFSAVLHHRKAGFKANAMAVWKVSPERSEEVGRIMASSPWVTHCYERPTFPDWPYSHFSMVHATSKKGCEEAIKQISESTGLTDYMLLYSTREYKKTRVRYFV
jgi:DNA-binding Lrp family transcriptional regulator